MATKIKGPLTLGSEAADQDYNHTMRGLMDQLIQTPEQQAQDELLAWGGGLSDPSGQGRLIDSAINATKAQSTYRLEDRKLRAQYIPLIMNALGTQSSTAYGMVSGEELRGMKPERVMQLNVLTGKDHLPAWKIANGLETATPGSYRLGFQNGQTQIEDVLPTGDKANPIVVNGKVVGAANLPGASVAAGQTAGATKFAEETAKNLTGTKDVYIGNTKYNLPIRELQPQPTEFPAMFGGPQGPSVHGPLTTPQPQTGGVPTGAIPAPMPTIPAPQTPMPAGGGAAPVGPIGTKITPQQQRALDSDIPAILNGELVKAQQRLAAATTQDEKDRAEQDIAGLQREMKAKKIPVMAPGAVIKAPPPAVAAPVAVAAPATALPQQRTGLPSSAVQVELSPGQQQQIKNTEQASARFNDLYKGLQSKNFSDEEQQLRQAEAAFMRMGRTGPITTEARKQVADIMSAFGVKADEKYLSNYQMAEQAINSRVNAAIMADRGVATEGDAKRHKEATMRLNGTPEYNRYMLDTYKAALERDKQKLNFFNEAMQNRDKIPNGDLEQISIAWAKRIQKPLADMPSMAKWKKRYGWD